MQFLLTSVPQNDPKLVETIKVSFIFDISSGFYTNLENFRALKNSKNSRQNNLVRSTTLIDKFAVALEVV